MKPELIVMLTHHDQTVNNAVELFTEAQEVQINHWGFKDIGLPPDTMRILVENMKTAGKTTYLEVVSLSEKEGLTGAKLAVDFGFDVLMGTVFYDSILDYLKDKAVKYYPFSGHVYGHPSILDGTIDEIVEYTLYLEEKGIDGIDLLTYRFTGDAKNLLSSVVDCTKLPIVSAGSIASFQRISEVWRAGAWGFTIGSAFFDGKFVEGGSFVDNLMAMNKWLKFTEEPLPEKIR